MAKSIFHTKTKEDYLEAVRQLSELTGDSLGGIVHHAVCGEETCIFATQALLGYGNYSYAVSQYGKEPQLFKVGMKIVKAPSNSEEYFIAVAQGNDAALKKIEELEAKVAELKAELTAPAEPLYKVVLPNPNSTALFVVKKNEENSVILQRITHSQKNSDFLLLTEEEIKKDFEWAWQFAERVK
ncbi:hypothetical protein [Enterococcus sp. AZ136]|uniref:hypothetical protein n=1 Tax=Enterococcus sp. AZ136 TaxID=2774788 RepID=UPI003D2DCAC1